MIFVVLIRRVSRIISLYYLAHIFEDKYILSILYYVCKQALNIQISIQFRQYFGKTIYI